MSYEANYGNSITPDVGMSIVHQLLNHCATGMKGFLVVPYDVVSSHGYLGLSYDSQSFYLDFDCQ